MGTSHPKRDRPLGLEQVPGHALLGRLLDRLPAPDTQDSEVGPQPSLKGPPWIARSNLIPEDFKVIVVLSSCEIQHVCTYTDSIVRV